VSCPQRAGDGGGRRASATVLRPKFESYWGLGSSSRGWRSWLRGRWEKWAVDRRCPQRAVVVGVEEEGVAVELGSGVRELAEELGERDVGALVVFMRTRDKVLGFCSRLSTATARWRPSRGSGSRGACERGQWRGKIGPGQGERDA
jgi:hypothetical protein